MFISHLAPLACSIHIKYVTYFYIHFKSGTAVMVTNMKWTLPGAVESCGCNMDNFYWWACFCQLPISRRTMRSACAVIVICQYCQWHLSSVPRIIVNFSGFSVGQITGPFWPASATINYWHGCWTNHASRDILFWFAWGWAFSSRVSPPEMLLATLPDSSIALIVATGPS